MDVLIGNNLTEGKVENQYSEDNAVSIEKVETVNNLTLSKLDSMNQQTEIIIPKGQKGVLITYSNGDTKIVLQEKYGSVSGSIPLNSNSLEFGILGDLGDSKVKRV